MERQNQILAQRTPLGLVQIRPGAANPPDSLSRLARTCRHRTLLAGALLLFGICVGGSIGWVDRQPMYSATASFRAKSAADTPAVVATAIDPAFSGVNQRLLRVDLAQLIASTPEWQQSGMEVAPEAIARRFDGRLRLVRGKGDLVLLTFDDPDPERARLVTQAVLRALVAAHEREQGEIRERELDQLQRRRSELLERRATLTHELHTLSASAGTSDVDALFRRRAAELAELEARLNETVEALRLASSNLDVSGDIPASPRQIARRDPVMQSLLEAEAAAQAEVNRLFTRLGDQHPLLVDARARLARLQDEIARLAAGASASPEIAIPGPNLASRPAVVSIEQLRQREAALRKAVDAKRQVLDELSDVAEQAASIKLALDDVRSRLDRTGARMEELAMQAELGSVTVVNDGSQPPLFLGLNGMQSAVRGALIGGGICFVVLLLIASTDRRVRGVSDLQEIEAPSPVLGVLQHLSQPAASGAAACSVRKIAAHLQLSAAGGRGGVFSINSAHIGAGKTSLVLAVGTALAEAGSKTLLIDLDLREQGLTRRTTDIIDRAIADSSDEPTIRLSDAIPPQPLHEPVRPTCVPGLHVMCVREAGVMSVQAIRQLFHEARQRFDVVLVDTGAIGYCPAALVSAAEADGAVLVVARGEDRDTVRRCAHQLTQLDVKLLGIIYNHATGRDAMFWPDQPSGGSRRAGDRLDPLSGSLIADRYRASA